MAYSTWVVIRIVNSSNKTVVVKNVQVRWGKFYTNDDKEQEIPKSYIENKKIAAGEVFIISSCGKNNVRSGTEAEFDVYEDGDKVRHFYWNCPWESKTNTWSITEKNPNSKWMVDSTGGNVDGEELGTITVELFKKP